MEAEFRVNNNPSDLFYFCFFELNNGKKYACTPMKRITR